MPELTHTSLPIHLVKDVESGYYHVVADVEGMLLPLVSGKLGWLEDRLKAFGENGVHPAVTHTPDAPLEAPGSKGKK